MDAALLLARGVLGAALGSAWGFPPLPGAGATMTSSVGAVDDAAPGVAEALLLFALAVAAAGCAEGSRLAALGFAAAGTDGARGGARGTDAGVSPSFDIVLATATPVLCFIRARCAAANNSLSVFLNRCLLTAVAGVMPAETPR